MPELTIFEKVFVWTIPVLFAITVHEVAHGWVAGQLGDPTAKSAGRLTLNPIKHIDPLGTVILPLILLYVSNFIFGWAKPVPVSWKNLNHPRRDMALVALAGPAANLLMMILWALLAKLVMLFPNDANWGIRLIATMCSAGIIINIVLMVLNLLPILPLDGGRVISALLPVSWARTYSHLEPYGLIILIILLVTEVLDKTIGPIITGIQTFVYRYL